jgi:hypothetical protein
MTRFLCRSCATSSLLLPNGEKKKKKKKKTNTMSGSTGSRRNAKSVVRREEEKREEEMGVKSSWTTASPVTDERRKTKKNVVVKVVRNGIMDDKNNASTGSSFYDPFERSKFQKIGDEIDRRMFFPGGNGDDASTSASSSSSSPFFGLEEEFAKLDRELSDARERALLVGTEGRRRRRSAHEDFGPNKTVSKEISREHRGRHSYSNFRYAESVTTYGPSPPAAARVGRGSRQSLVDAPTLGLLLVLGTTYVYFKEKTTFARNFSATNFKEEEKEKLAREWPVLYLSSEAFRREFRKAKEKEEKREREKETRDEGKDDDDIDDRKR